MDAKKPPSNLQESLKVVLYLSKCLGVLSFDFRPFYHRKDLSMSISSAVYPVILAVFLFVRWQMIAHGIYFAGVPRESGKIR